MEPLPDLATLSDAELKKLIADLTREEHEVSYQRRLLHGKIDILRAELVARLQKTEGKSVLDDVDVERSPRSSPPRPHRPPRWPTSTARSAASRTRKPRTTAPAAARCS